MSTSNPVIKNFRKEESYSSFVGKSATYHGIVNKTAISFLLVIAVAIATFIYMPMNILMPTSVASSLLLIGALFFILTREVINFAHLALFALLEGLFVGSVSKLFASLYDGIVVQAIAATFVVTIVTLAFYKVTGFRVTPKFRKVVFISTLSLLLVYLGNLLLSFFNIHTGVVEVGKDAGVLSMVVSGVAVLLATFNLVIDFDDAQTVVERGSPVNDEWKIAIGLIITLVWMYIELLRIISYFRD